MGRIVASSRSFIGFNAASIAADMMLDKSAGKVGAQCCGCGLTRAWGAGVGTAAITGTGARDTAAAQTDPSPALRCCEPFGDVAESPATMPAQDLGVSVPELRTNCELGFSRGAWYRSVCREHYF